jgi:NAD(P)-dependent dehydrogenase (short-subunit alcohol dehydrogenase family)
MCDLEKAVKMARLKNKVAVITGAASGIGSAATRLFAQEGAQVLAVARTEATLDQLVASAGDGVSGFVADVTQPEQVDAAMATAVERYGGIDIVIANAGIFGVAAAIEEYPNSTFGEVLSVNVTGVFLTIKYAVPHMVRRGGGSVVITSSALAVKALPHMIAYQTSKHALTGLVKAAAVELASAGIRVNSVNPGLVETPMIHLIEREMNPEDPEAARKAICEGALFKYYLQPEEVAEVMLFLVSENSRSCTGAMYMIDQGVTLL